MLPLAVADSAEAVLGSLNSPTDEVTTNTLPSLSDKLTSLRGYSQRKINISPQLTEERYPNRPLREETSSLLHSNERLECVTEKNWVLELGVDENPGELPPLLAESQ